MGFSQKTVRKIFPMKNYEITKSLDWVYSFERFFVKDLSNSLKTFCSFATLSQKDKSFEGLKETFFKKFPYNRSMFGGIRKFLRMSKAIRNVASGCVGFISRTE